MCTRVVYLGADGIVVTARSMDWMSDIHSDLWVFARGLKRNGAAGPEIDRMDVPLRQRGHGGLRCRIDRRPERTRPGRQPALSRRFGICEGRIRRQAQAA